MKLKIIRTLILLCLGIILGVLVLRSLSWLLLISSEGNFFAAGLLFILSLLVTQILVKKVPFLKDFKKAMISLLFVGLFLLPAVAVGGPFGLSITVIPVMYYIIERKIHAPTPTLMEIIHTPQLLTQKMKSIKKTQKLNYMIDSENGVVVVKHRGIFHLFAFYNIDLLLKIDILKSLLKRLFENNCNVRSLELIKWNNKISVILTLGSQHFNYLKALAKLEEEEFLLESILKANKINYRKLEDPFNLELAYLGPILFNDYFHHGIIRNYQLTPANFSEIDDSKSKLMNNKDAHIIFLVKKIDRQIFEREKQRLLDELKNSLGLSDEKNASTIALMALTSKDNMEETLGISDIKEKLQKLKELEEKGIWYVNAFIFNCTTEKPEGVPLSFVLRKLVYQKVEDSFSISGDIQNATIGLLNSLSLIDSIKSNKE